MNLNKNDRQFIEKIIVFSVFFVAIFGVTFAVLYILGLVPKTIRGNSPVSEIELKAVENFSTREEEAPFAGEKPTYISIPAINVSIDIYTPPSKDVAVLDEYLKKGVVRYPDSGLLGKGNMFLFGHSADAYKNVSNPAYTSFNKLGTLQVGDSVYVDSENQRYVYVVDTVKKADAETEYIDFGIGGDMLTLSTCDTFGKKQERFIVTARFARSEAK